jgi:hypothetical protein
LRRRGKGNDEKEDKLNIKRQKSGIVSKSIRTERRWCKKIMEEGKTKRKKRR